jgi:Tol biopolymer transport system component
MQKFIPPLIAFALLNAAVATAFAQAKVDEQVVGPAVQDAKYVVSLRGAHLATVAPKGSRVNVIVDGVAGPRFDQIVEISNGAIDWRPYKDIDPNSDERPQGGPVTFSKDGSRYAYLARLGQEWVIMVDNKESFRLPASGAVGAVAGIAGMAGNTDVRMEFTGESGKHLLFAKSGFSGYELWVDGRKWPGFYQDADPLSPIISPDGEHIAYPAQMDADARNSKHALILDGKDTGYYGERPQFTPDSKHLICVSQNPKGGQAVLVDGKPVFAAEQIVGVYIAPVGNRLIFEAYSEGQSRLIVDGKPVMVNGKPVNLNGNSGARGNKVVFSPNGKRYAAICGQTPNAFVIVDGKKEQEYAGISSFGENAQTVAFSADSSKLAYIAQTQNAARGNGTFVVINGEESEGLGLNTSFWFSPDGKRIAYAGDIGSAGQQKAFLSIDGKSQPLDPKTQVQNFTFSPDSSRYAFRSAAGGMVFLDGKETGIVSAGSQKPGDTGFQFSPDSKRFAVRGGRPADGKNGLFVDNQLVFSPSSSYVNLQYQAFTPDSQHLLWVTQEPAIGAKAAPGNSEYVLYADGKPVARSDAALNTTNSSVGTKFIPYPTNSWKMPRAWRANAAGQLNFIGVVDGDIKRHTITPAADASIASMIADIKAAEAKAITDAKAAKEKAEADKKAAAEARAKAEADAAAKAKADYDAQVAANAKARADAQSKAKADYDARVAKQKADYDAAMAKRKADYDAAVAARAEALKKQQQKK